MRADRHRNRWAHRWPPQHGHRLLQLVAAALFALALCAALALMSVPAGAETPPGPPQVPPLATTPPTGSPSAPPSTTATATATATTPPPTATPASLALLSPRSGRGPVGANLSVSGAGYAGSSVTIFAAPSTGCDSRIATLGSAPVSSGAISLYTFIWPASLTGGQYFVCAPGVTAAPGYTVLGSEPPALALSASQVPVGQQLTVTGTSFYTAAVTVTLTQGAKNTQLQTVAPGSDGRFTFSFTVDSTYSNSYTIAADSNPENGAPSALHATADFSVAPAGTATAGGTTGTTPPPSNSNSSLGLIIVLIVGIILTLLVIAGVVAYLVIQRRRAGPANAPVPVGPDGRPISTYGQQTGRYSGTDQYGWPSMPGQTDPFARRSSGGVARWDEPDSSPGADWQPRPMTGNWRGYDEQSGARYGSGPGYGAPAEPPGASGPPPRDPWAGSQGGYGSQGGAGGASPARPWQADEGARPEWDDDWPGRSGPGSTRADRGG